MANSRFKKIKVRTPKQRRTRVKSAGVERPHTSFNIFTKDGRNLTEVKSPRPMLLAEAQAYFNALSIGAND
jgi:hypothetical protein